MTATSSNQPSRTLLIATSNPGKLQEYRELLDGLPVTLLDLRAVGIHEPVEETGTTFEENARLKAETYARLSGLLTLADDSGLEVDALGGEPGLHSARYGGPGLDDAGRCRLLLRNLEATAPAGRTARFVCVIALAGNNRETITVEGTIEGMVGYEPHGEFGFGYDPVFILPDRNCTMAEIEPEEKNRISHRGQAAQKIVPYVAQIARSEDD
jgi:XTP/dITP diphosphohydrolase